MVRAQSLLLAPTFDLPYPISDLLSAFSEMSDVVIQVDSLWKKYRLGVLGTGTPHNPLALHALHAYLELTIWK